MNEQEKTKKLEMLPWQALFDLAISKEIDENDIKGKEKSTIIFKIIHEALISDSEIDNLVNDYIYGDRVAFTLWNFENKLTPEQYEKVYQLEGEIEPYLQANSFRGLTILSAKNCTDRIEVLYVYSKEYQFINEAGKSDSVWEQHRGCLWIGVGTAYLACISKHDKMTGCVIEYIVRKIGVPLTQVKPPKTAIERCINQVARSRVVLQGTNGEKTVVSRSEGLTAAQQEEIQRIQSDRFDTSGSYIAAISEDTQATVKYNVKKGSIGIFKHLPAPVLFNWSQSAIEIILEEIENLKGRPAKEIFKELGLDIKWSYLYNEEDKIAAEWFLSNAISCLGSAEGAMYEIPEHVKPILRKSQLFTVIPRIYCEQCGSYEIPYCAECGKPMEFDENGRLHCSCGAPFHVQCFEGHRACRVENWYIPTSRMYTMINQNIHAAFKQDTADLVMCIMGSALYIAQPCIVRTEGVEVFFNQIDCFSCLPATAKENTKKYAVYLGEKCDGTCSNAKIGRCIADSSMACLPKAFYTLLPGFRPQPHKGLEYGDVAAQINVGSCAYEMKGIIKKNTMNSGRTSKSVDVLLNTHLLSTSKAGEEIIRQFVEQGLVDNRVDLIAVIAPQYFDNSFKGTLRFLAKLGGKKVMFIELDDVARLIEGNSAIDV